MVMKTPTQPRMRCLGKGNGMDGDDDRRWGREEEGERGGLGTDAELEENPLSGPYRDCIDELASA